MAALAGAELELIKRVTKEEIEWNPILPVPGLLICLLAMVTGLQQLLNSLLPMSATAFPTLTTLVSRLGASGALLLGGCALEDSYTTQPAEPDPTLESRLAVEIVAMEAELAKFPRMVALFMIECSTPKAYKNDLLLEAAVETTQRFLWQLHSELFNKILDTVAKVRPIVVEVQCKLSFANHAPVAAVVASAGS